ncbi:hypothetical protein NOVOSPHI9U_490002 [Novosphingobium sp. 9U]|nr:hypothetical protein NOVOSPHI9U_490002 [Novosphingobium sp. 9U]
MVAALKLATLAREMPMFKVHLAATCAAVALMTSAPQVAAKDHSWQVGNDSFHVYYSELDLNSAAGRAELLARVTRSANQLCRDRFDKRDCVAATVETTSLQPQASALRLAMAESKFTKMAQH